MVLFIHSSEQHGGSGTDVASELFGWSGATEPSSKKKKQQLKKQLNFLPADPSESPAQDEEDTPPELQTMEPLRQTASANLNTSTQSVCERDLLCNLIFSSILIQQRSLREGKQQAVQVGKLCRQFGFRQTSHRITDILKKGKQINRKINGDMSFNNQTPPLILAVGKCFYFG